MARLRVTLLTVRVTLRAADAVGEHDPAARHVEGVWLGVGVGL